MAGHRIPEEKSEFSRAFSAARGSPGG